MTSGAAYAHVAAETSEAGSRKAVPLFRSKVSCKKKTMRSVKMVLTFLLISICQSHPI